MNLYFYRGEKPNFGDELNTWMWPRLLPGVWDFEQDRLFLGTGSILFDFFPEKAQKIVCGAGYAGYTAAPKIDDKWKVYFVRGKLTAQTLNLDPKLAIGDSAILLRSCLEKIPSKNRRISFMPHWESTLFGAWKEACGLASINFIDPTSSVENTLNELLSSDLVITEAMHGAIVSDALRIPWIAVEPLHDRHRMKWQDWASPLELKLAFEKIGPSSLLEMAVQWAGSDLKLISRIRRRGGFLQNVLPNHFIDKAAAHLVKISQTTPSLSRDEMINNAHEKMLQKLAELRIDLKY